jgi:acetyltransferase-like isoleucine patch superfamily enzyme
MLLKLKFIFLDIYWFIKRLNYQFRYRHSFKKHCFIDRSSVIQLLHKDQLKLNGSITLGRSTEIVLVNKNSKFTIGENFCTRSECKIRVDNGHLKIGTNVFINNGCSINCLEEIEIGDHVLFGEGVKIYDHNHKFSISNNIVNIAKDDYTVSKVSIGANSWIASNVIILKGVSIGKNCIIGAGCIIYKSIPDNSVIKCKQDLIQESN